MGLSGNYKRLDVAGTEERAQKGGEAGGQNCAFTPPQDSVFSSVV